MNILDQLPLILSYGMCGVFFIALLEKMIPIVPSYLLLILLGMVAADSTTFFWTFMATISGSLTGSMIWYLLGRSLGEYRVKSSIKKYGKYVFLKLETYEHLANSYKKNRFIVSLIGQIIPIARIYLALPAGILKIKPLLFLIASIIGISFYNVVFLTIGSFLQGTTHDPLTIGIWTLSILVTVTVEVSFVLVIRFYKNKFN